MAKKSKKKEDETNEVVANCDHPDEVIANCENPQENSLSQYDIEKLIVTVRGEQVLIDQDIARIYGVTTGRLNEQAKRIEKRINNCLKEIFDCGISKLDLIRRIVDYKEDDIQKGGNIL